MQQKLPVLDKILLFCNYFQASGKECFHPFLKDIVLKGPFYFTP